MKFIENTHDLTVSQWGPYSKRYAGISHVADEKMGMRFDLSVFPAMYRRKLELPHCMFETNYHVWESSADFSYFSTRHEIEWKDRVYTDVSYSRLEEDTYIIRANCVNQTDSFQNLVLHYLASIHYPSLSTKYNEENINPISYQLPEKSVLIDGLAFEEYKRAKSNPTDSLVPDGLRRGEQRLTGFTRGSGLQMGQDEGDKIHYFIHLQDAFVEPVVVVRSLNKGQNEMILQFEGDIKGAVTIPSQSEISMTVSDIEINDNIDLSFYISGNKGSLLLDSFVICEKSEVSRVAMNEMESSFDPTSWELGKEEETEYLKNRSLDLNKKDLDESEENMVILKYRDSDNYYGMCWDYDGFVIRYLKSTNLDVYLKVMAHEHFNKTLGNEKDACYTDVFLKPIPIPPGSEMDVYGAVCCGSSKEEVRKKLKDILDNRKIMEETVASRKQEVVTCKTTPEGEKYAFSQNVMIATTLTNVCYPIYTKNEYIKHNTPGKWWDSLYTWDSGFAGLGLATCDNDRAVDCLNAYVTEVGDAECAFIHHGTPLPIQFYLLQQLYNQTQSKEMLAFYYPRLKQYYSFLAGELGSSDTGKFKSNLLSTWSYFYNSAGWDDYPPQYYMHDQKLTESVTCVSTTAHSIRCAKLLKQIAIILDEKEDIAHYDENIEKFTEAIQKYTWDKESGYFGYLCHDEGRNPTEIFRYKNGENFNKGLDGTSPMIATILTKEQEEIICHNLMDEEKLFTKIGLSTVDMSAAYYKREGYWNGSVWMPHQWFYFKSLLDYGYGAEAFKIAETGLKLWENEVSDSYNCFEHFVISSGRGAGWHHFSGLSTPVLLWHESYFKEGTITCGFGGLITKKEIKNQGKTVEFNITFADQLERTTIVVVMPESESYHILVDGVEAESVKRVGSAVEVNLSVKPNETRHIVVSGK